ncbi:MAG: hypothetical protein JWN71_926 [Xanthobacteraceae bacterium]|jgi:hypothetical protein|nr:hypothetical protein [Xanthobacteraceae bacterium]
MPTALARNWKLAAGVAALVGWLIAFDLWERALTTPPLDEPISLSAKAAVDKMIRVRLAATYMPEFVFGVDRASYAEGQKRLRDPGGVAVPIVWSVTDLAGSVVASANTETTGMIGWSFDRLFRQIAPSIRMEPGEYRFRAEIQRDVPELRQFPTRISLRLPGNASFGWQSDVIFWGNHLNLFLVAPVTFVLLLLLGWRLLRRRV